VGRASLGCPTGRIAAVRVLVSSDDGAGAPGLLALVRALQPHTVTSIVRPSESSDGGNGTALRSANGRRTCACIVRNACLRDPAIALVALGVNFGPNVLPEAIHSGTVGGLLTAMSHGMAAVAFSADDVYSARDANASPDFLTAERVAAACVSAVLMAPERYRGVGVSINIPARRIDDIEEVVDVSGDGVLGEGEALRRGWITVRRLAPFRATTADLPVELLCRIREEISGGKVE
jgi:broad specificity polyphosphatase/5'/3'-nucleotidase SurE